MRHFRHQPARVELAFFRVEYLLLLNLRQAGGEQRRSRSVPYVYLLVNGIQMGLDRAFHHIEVPADLEVGVAASNLQQDIPFSCRQAGSRIAAMYLFLARTWRSTALAWVAWPLACLG